MKIIWIVSIALVFLSWTVTAICYPKMPDRIPIHYNAKGEPDGWSKKGFWSVFLIPLIQTIIVPVLLIPYFKPQFSNIPTTFALELIPEGEKAGVYRQIKRFVTLMGLWISLFLTFMGVGIALNGIGTWRGLNPIAIWGWTALTIPLTAGFAVKIWKTVRSLR